MLSNDVELPLVFPIPAEIVDYTWCNVLVNQLGVAYIVQLQNVRYIASGNNSNLFSAIKDDLSDAAV